jgi:hypothetical protein
MNDLLAQGLAAKSVDTSLFTILGGTTIPDRAAIVRAECREGSRVELRRRDADDSHIDVWLECRPRLRLMKAWKRIGHVPEETAASLLPFVYKDSTVVAQGMVKTVYAPAGRDEAVVTVEIRPPSQAWASRQDTAT